MFVLVNVIWRLSRLKRLGMIGGMARSAEGVAIKKIDGNETINIPEVMSRMHTVRLNLKLTAFPFISLWS